MFVFELKTQEWSLGVKVLTQWAGKQFWGDEFA